jgi:hypothetical protein
LFFDTRTALISSFLYVFASGAEMKCMGHQERRVGSESPHSSGGCSFVPDQSVAAVASNFIQVSWDSW